MTEKGSIKETGEELPQEDWARFEKAVDSAKAKADSDVQTDRPFNEEAESTPSDEVRRPNVPSRRQTAGAELTKPSSAHEHWL